MATKINLFQIHYNQKQVAYLDPAFQPWDNSADPRPEWCEYHVFRTAWQRGQMEPDAITGIFSWKFLRKTWLTGPEVRGFIEANSHADIFLFNPFRTEMLMYKNVWRQAENDCPGFIELSEQLLGKLGHRLNLSEGWTTDRDGVYCNYWAARKEVWERYFAFTEPIYEFIESKQDAELTRRLMERPYQDSGIRFVPYIFERLICTFLQQNPDIKVAPWIEPAATTELKLPGDTELIEKALRNRNLILNAPTPPTPEAEQLLEEYLKTLWGIRLSRVPWFTVNRARMKNLAAKLLSRQKVLR